MDVPWLGNKYPTMSVVNGFFKNLITELESVDVKGDPVLQESVDIMLLELRHTTDTLTQILELQ